MRRALSFVFTAVLMVSVVACSSGGSSGSGSSTTSAATASSETTGTVGGSSTTAGANTTLGPQPAPGAVPFIESYPVPPADGTSPAGSGCTPGTTATLPDGRWFGILQSIDSAGGTIGFDLECLFTGDAANAAATADSASEVPVPNDVYVRNESSTVRTLPAVADVAVGLLQDGGASTSFEPTKAGLAAAAPLVDRPVWVLVTGGWVVAIQQQYFP